MCESDEKRIQAHPKPTIKANKMLKIARDRRDTNDDNQEQAQAQAKEKCVCAVRVCSKMNVTIKINLKSSTHIIILRHDDAYAYALVHA